MSKLSIALVTLALLSAPGVAAGDPNDKGKVDDGDKIVCKVDKTTGSAISERICKKRSVWQAEREDARRVLDESANRSPSRMPARPGG